MFELIKKVWTSQMGAVSRGMIVALFVVGILAFVLYMVIASFAPSASVANASVQALSTNDTGASMAKPFFNFGMFLIPVGIFVALFITIMTMVNIKGGGPQRWFHRKH